MSLDKITVLARLLPEKQAEDVLREVLDPMSKGEEFELESGIPINRDGALFYISPVWVPGLYNVVSDANDYSIG